jgi:hypothetical protein
MEAIELYDNFLKEKSYQELSKELNVSVGTLKRWNKNRRVPQAYIFYLMKLNGIEIDYSLFSFKEKDQFFTPDRTALYCYTKFKEILELYNENENLYNYIEPSAGSGNFLKILPSGTMAFDIDPKNKKIKKQDFLEWFPSSAHKYIVFGNPPFGLRGELALKFINHSYNFADYVCFILPQLFKSDGKGSPRKRVKGFNLIHSEEIDNLFSYPDGKEIKVNCIFQIWSRMIKNEKYEIKKNRNEDIKIYSLSNGGTPSSTRNKEMLNKCDIYIPSTCYGKDNMKYYESFEELPNRRGYGIIFKKLRDENIKNFKKIEWEKVAYLSTNSAYNLRSSQIERALINRIVY